MQKKEINIDSLFASAGISKKGVIELNENTYDFDPANPKDSWLYGAFLSFMALKQKGFSPRIFGTIGTGSGTDSIGAGSIFDLERIIQTDIHPNVIAIAQRNARCHVRAETAVETHLGDLCIPLIDQGVRVDLLYANIPNIPSEQPVWEKKVSSSRFYAEPSDVCPKLFDTWFLKLQFQFLSQAKKVLTSGGILLIAIGDRIPVFVMKQLFSRTGFRYSELVNIYKKQTEIEEVVTGYAEQEIRENIEFDFYDHEQALRVWQNQCDGKNMSIAQIKEILKPFHLNAFDALRQFRKKGRPVGHIYTIFKLEL